MSLVKESLNEFVGENPMEQKFQTFLDEQFHAKGFDHAQDMDEPDSYEIMADEFLDLLQDMGQEFLDDAGYTMEWEDFSATMNMDAMMRIAYEHYVAAF